MEVSDSGEFTRRLIALGELFDAKLSPVKQALYFEALRDVPFDAVARALNLATRNCTFMPRPAELRTFALGDAEDQAETAWLALKAAMRTAGGYASLILDDAALGETVVALFGSWPAACSQDLSPEMWASTRKSFGRVYRVMRQRGLTGARYLTGRCEQENAGRPEWFAYVPVKRVTANGTLLALEAGAADDARAEIATTRPSGFSRLTDGDVQAALAKETA